MYDLKNSKWFGCLLFAAYCLLSSCESNPLDVEVSSVKIEPVQLQRFDQDFFSLSADNISKKLPEMQKKYPGFTDLFLRNIVCTLGINDSACIPDIIRFVKDKDMREAYDDCKKNFSDVSEIEWGLSSVFRHHKYYFPEKKLPKIFSMMSGFNYAIVSADTSYAIGLEMYLGGKSRFYEMMQIPAYKKTVMRKEFIITDLVHKWMMDEFPNSSKSGTLLNEMIYQGKLLYLSDALMPEVNDTLKIGFSQKQLRWCVGHEKDVWGYLIKNKFLYSSAAEVISKFTGEGPFTTGLVKESPARAGIWIGWNIVRKYMAENPKTSLEELMKENDGQIILSKSKYKP